MTQDFKIYVCISYNQNMDETIGLALTPFQQEQLSKKYEDVVKDSIEEIAETPINKSLILQTLEWKLGIVDDKFSFTLEDIKSGIWANFEVYLPAQDFIAYSKKYQEIKPAGTGYSSCVIFHKP